MSNDLDFATLQAALLRRPQPPSRGMQGSVMIKPDAPAPEPYIGLPSQQEPGLEQVSPEDFVPNPKTLAAMASKAVASKGAMLAGMTSGEALREARKYAALLKGKERSALEAYTDPGNILHAFDINTTLRKGVPLKPEEQEYVDTLTGILRKAPQSDTPFPMYRGLPASQVNKKDKGFMSVTNQEGSAQAYGENIEDDIGNLVGTSVRFDVPKGAPLVDPDIKQWWDDGELLMPRGSTIHQPGFNEIYAPPGKLILPPEFRR